MQKGADFGGGGGCVESASAGESAGAGVFSAEELAAFLRRFDRCALATSANCCALLYVCSGTQIVFISHKNSAHAKALKAAGWANLAIFAPDALEGISARAVQVPTTAAHKAAYFAAHPAAALAIGHELFALKITHAKYKNRFKKAIYEAKNE